MKQHLIIFKAVNEGIFKKLRKAPKILSFFVPRAKENANI
jgi:hypothetical protein